MTSQRLLRISAWSIIIAIFVITVAPVGLRPTLGIGLNKERAIAFAAVAFLFVLAYPRRALLVLALLILTAEAFELLQLRHFGRHASLMDVAFKVAGAVFGVLCGVIVNGIRATLAPRQSASREEGS